MNVQPHFDSVPCLRKFLLYRSQWMINFVLAICIGGGIIAIQVMIGDSATRAFLTLLFLIITILIAVCHLVLTLRTISYVVNPIEGFMNTLEVWICHTTDKSTDEISLSSIQGTIMSLRDTMTTYQKGCPKEVQQLHSAFEHTLKVMEAAWQHVGGNAILVGLGNVCSQVAHDIRSPLASIRVISQTFADPNLTLEDRQERCQLMLRSTDKLNRMADELLEYRRATAIDIRPMDLSQIIQSVLGEVDVQAQKLGVAVEHDVQISDSVRGDADKLGRVVQNLVQNSVQALKGMDGAKVNVKARQLEDTIELSVTDNGPGIPEQYMGQLFKKGFTTKGKKGTGLGLIYCETVVRGHGGQISARNLPEGGAQFQITLPCPTVN